MLRGLLLVGAVVAGAVLVGSAGAARRARAASGHKTVTVKIPLPSLQQSQISAVTVNAKAPKGKEVGSLKVHTANDAQLGDESIVYFARAPRRRSASETFKVYALINRFGSARDHAGSATTASTGTLNVTVDAETAEYLTVHFSPKVGDCGQLKFWDGLFESGATVVNSSGNTYTLVSGRPQSRQSTKPEGVLDDIIASQSDKKGCISKPEGYDPGAA